jgi:hypothetical protein
MGRDANGLAEIGHWQAAGVDAHTEAPGSLLNVIDGLTEPHQTSHLIGYLLHTAVDHLHALSMLMENAKFQGTHCDRSRVIVLKNP